MVYFLTIHSESAIRIFLFLQAAITNQSPPNHGKTKSATLQKRNVIFKAKTKCTKITEKATHLSGFFHLFKRYLNNIQKEQYIV